ncbi:four helix bundle protein [Candidatus Parcubacteria bacterium]|nr:four helix bundle protein [Candidatus Parcubacteria bacterium]
MKENIIQDKSFDFAVRIVNLYKYLAYIKKEYVLSKQVLRCGTSIGANIEEALGGQSKKDFIAKLSISYKEARETRYWLRLLCKTNFIDSNSYSSIINDCDELCRIISKILITLKANNNKNF